jgi:hypothetical protein
MPHRRPRLALPERRPSRAMLGEFKETAKEEVKVRYDDKREKDYYQERKYSKTLQIIWGIGENADFILKRVAGCQV